MGASIEVIEWDQVPKTRRTKTTLWKSHITLNGFGHSSTTKLNSIENRALKSQRRKQYE
eukprot:m.10252 g.10252  ORF g.10252 m.10252 type:complete len:59 (-) comp4232_c0_seq1:204-380(-)